MQTILNFFIDKKKIIGWISAGLIGVGAAYSGMSTKEFKDAVCSAPLVESPK